MLVCIDARNYVWMDGWMDACAHVLRGCMGVWVHYSVLYCTVMFFLVCGKVSEWFQLF